MKLIINRNFNVVINGSPVTIKKSDGPIEVDESVAELAIDAGAASTTCMTDSIHLLQRNRRQRELNGKAISKVITKETPHAEADALIEDAEEEEVVEDEPKAPKKKKSAKKPVELIKRRRRRSK